MSAPISLYLFFMLLLYFPHLFPISLGFPTLSLGCQALGKGGLCPSSPLPTSAPGCSSSRNRKAGIPQGRPRADTAPSVSRASENVTREPPGATGHSPTLLDQPLRARDGGGETERLPRGVLFPSCVLPQVIPGGRPWALSASRRPERPSG